MRPRRYKEGIDRQSMPLPPTLEECIDLDNPVRAIEAYVETLDLRALGFLNADGELTPGQPAYDPAVLLKLYIWGYLNRTKSSRLLERECYRDLEVIWLLRGLHPSYKTICSFRANNAKAITGIVKDFLSVCKELNLLGGELVGIDSAFFEGDASKASIKTKAALQKSVKALESKIKSYLEEKGWNEGSEEADEDQMFQELKNQHRDCQRKLDALEKSGDTQYSETDKDARILVKRTDKGPTAGYSVQCAVDAKHKLIVAHDVVNDGNDSSQLAPLAKQAMETMGVDQLAAAADGGYYNQQQIKECEDAGIVPYVPISKRSVSTEERKRFERQDFHYDPDADRYVCPTNESLLPCRSQNKNGKLMKGYASKQETCEHCPLHEKCLPEKTPYRQIFRWEHEDTIERHKERMENDKGKHMHKRAELAEHPFGTMKLWMGWTHFLLRGFEKVRTEMNLLVTCYNLKRVLNILGIEDFLDYCRQRRSAVCSKKEGCFILFFRKLKLNLSKKVLFLNIQFLYLVYC